MFDCTTHNLLAVKFGLSSLALVFYIVSFFVRKPAESSMKLICWWMETFKRGKHQGQCQRPAIIYHFPERTLNDLEVYLARASVLFTYANDTSILYPVWSGKDPSKGLIEQFLEWSSHTWMPCSPSKFKGFIFWKKGCSKAFTLVSSVPQNTAVVILSITFQENSRFTVYVRRKLIKANKILFIFILCERKVTNRQRRTAISLI